MSSFTSSILTLCPAMVYRVVWTRHHFISVISTLRHIQSVLWSSQYCILLSTNTVTMTYTTHIHTVPYVQGDKPFKAYQQVIEERPLAAVQIILAIFAVEALGQFNQVPWHTPQPWRTPPQHITPLYTMKHDTKLHHTPSTRYCLRSKIKSI